LKIIILIEKYGGFCNRLFQSLHYHAYSIENDIKFFNPSLLGLLKFDNNFFYFFDNLNNLILKIINKLIKLFIKKDQFCFYINKNNYIQFVAGWNYRKNKLTTKNHKVLKHIYSFDKRYLSSKSKFQEIFLKKLKIEGKFIVGVHIRRGDYKNWNQGKYYFDYDFYKNVIKKLKKKLISEKKHPYIIVLSDEKIKSDIEANYFSDGTWKEDQIILQSCDLIVGPPSTFTMWASYISKIPLIKLSSNKKLNFSNSEVCKG